jgi:hypothetical protein
MATILHLRFSTCNVALITQQNAHFRSMPNTLMSRQSGFSAFHPGTKRKRNLPRLISCHI